MIPGPATESLRTRGAVSRQFLNGGLA